MQKFPALVTAAGLIAGAALSPHPATAVVAGDPEPATDVDPALDGIVPPWIQADLEQSTRGMDPSAQSAPPWSPAQLAAASGPGLPVPAPTGPPLVTGRVSSSRSGSGRVLVYLTDEADAPLGQAVSYSPIGRADLGSNGTFVVSPAMQGRLREAMDDGGVVNLMIDGSLGGLGFRTYVTRQFDEAAQRWTTTDGSTDLSLAIEATIPIDQLAPTASGGAAAPAQYISCTSRQIRSYQVTAIVGEAQISKRFSGGTFKYTGGRSAELGVAVQAGTKAWAASGATSVAQESSASNEFPLNSNEHRVIYATFQYHDIRTQCSTGYSVSTTTEARPFAWNGGLWRGPTTPERYCGGDQAKYRQPISAGGTFTRDRTRAQTWSGGASVHGVGVTTRAGFSSAVKQTWKAGKNPTWVCGSNGPPKESARVFTSSSVR